jgi:hypothetical protein
MPIRIFKKTCSCTSVHTVVTNQKTDNYLAVKSPAHTSATLNQLPVSVVSQSSTERERGTHAVVWHTQCRRAIACAHICY